ncbi:MAG: sugar ABC transporter permease [Kiritimatiellaeota bacterium]|nr:sugar ABC transporter permease [Kiritimatiellota bacterium]
MLITRKWAGFAFIAPNVIGFLVLTFLPVLAAFALSLFRWDIFHHPEFVGLQNFIDLLGGYWDNGSFHWNDAPFWKYLGNTLYLMIGIPLGIISSLFLAIVLNQPLRGRYFFRLIFYLPSICGGIGMLLLWQNILNPEFGLLNTMLHAIGLPTPGWLTDPKWAKPAFIMMGLWSAMGGMGMILYLAGLSNISQELYEAARIDGASEWRQFLHITWPMVAPTTFFLFVTGIIGGFQGGFNAAYVLTRGGPAGSTTTISYYIYNHAFEYFNMGYASAIAVVLFFIVLVATMLNWRFGGKKVNYA